MTSFDTEERNCTKSLNPNKNVFQVCEIFYSIQGEGLMQGVPSILIRLQGCNLNCKWCDTNTSDFVLMSKNDILAQFKMFSCKNVIITGGEPTLLEELNELIIFLKSNGFHITVETNATIKRNLDCDLVSMSPKLSHSGNTAQRINIDAIRYYVSHNNYQIKFVCRDEEKDFKEVFEILRSIKGYDPERIMIMPLASTKEQLYNIQQNLIRLCVRHNIRYANRLQLQIWDNGSEK